MRWAKTILFFSSHMYLWLFAVPGETEKVKTDWVCGKLALPLLASAFAYVDSRELWDYSIRMAP